MLLRTIRIASAKCSERRRSAAFACSRKARSRFLGMVVARMTGDPPVLAVPSGPHVARVAKPIPVERARNNPVFDHRS